MDRLYIFLMFIPIITFHGFFQAWVAHRLGDDTARDDGRMILNPGAHIDLLGTLIMPAISLLFPNLLLLGWGRYIPVNPLYFKNPRRDEFLVALSGPVANILLSIAVLIAGRLATTSMPSILPLIKEFAELAVFLAFFYLLPFQLFEGWTMIRVAFNISAEWLDHVGLWWWLGLTALLLFTPFLNILINVSHATAQVLISMIGVQ